MIKKLAKYWTISVGVKEDDFELFLQLEFVEFRSGIPGGHTFEASLLSQKFSSLTKIISFKIL